MIEIFLITWYLIGVIFFILYLLDGEDVCLSDIPFILIGGLLGIIALFIYLTNFNDLIIFKKRKKD